MTRAIVWQDNSRLPAHAELTETAHWKAKGGANYVFYEPHPGFQAGIAELPMYELVCKTLNHAMHIVVEAASRYMEICRNYADFDEKLLIMPCGPASMPVRPAAQQQGAFVSSLMKATLHKDRELCTLLGVSISQTM